MRSGRRFLGSVLVTSLVLGHAESATAYPRPGRTERVSVGSDGAQADRDAVYPSLSADGRFVTFQSDSAVLVPGDTNGVRDVFVRDRLTGTTERVSTGPSGQEANGDSSLALISRGGRHVVFATASTNLAGSPGVVVKDRQTGAVELVSISGTGTPSDMLTTPRGITPDGRFVLFETRSSVLVPGDTNGLWDVFLRDRLLGTTERVSVSDGEAQLQGDSVDASFSDDGRFVAFNSVVTSPPLDALAAVGDTIQVLLRDRQEGRTTLVSTGLDGGFPNGWATSPDVSNDGRIVAFMSQASNLVPADSNRAADIFVRDLASGLTERVSVSSAGAQANDRSVNPVMTGDGRFVMFQSDASNLVPEDDVPCFLPPPPPVPPTQEDPGSCWDVFVHDRLTSATERAGLGDGDAIPSTHAYGGAISEDARHVAFSTDAPNLAPADTNGVEDVFVRDRGPALGPGEVTAEISSAGASVSGWATYSGATVAAADDDRGDAGPALEDAGAEVTGGRLAYRHEEGELVATIAVASMPSAGVPNVPAGSVACILITGCPPGAAATPLVHGVAFTADGVRWMARAVRQDGEYPFAPAEPGFTLYWCQPLGCIVAARLDGGYATTGNEIRMELPLSIMDLEAGDPLEEIEAFSGVGDANAGTEIDVVSLGTGAVPIARVELGVAGQAGPAPAGSTKVFGAAFQGTISAEEFPGPDRRLWARACLDSTCSVWTRAA